MIDLNIIRSYTELLEFEPEWLSLLEQGDDVTPFQRPEWLLTWWRHFGSGELHVLVFRDRTTVVAVFPCFILNWEGRRQLTLIGSGVSDYLGPAVLSNYEEPVRERLVRYFRQSQEWTVANWQDLSDGSFLSKMTETDFFEVDIQADVPCAEIQIQTPFAHYWAERPTGLQRNIRRYGEKTRRLGQVLFAVSATPDQELLDALTQLHKARWREQGEQGMIEANRSENFLREVALTFAQKGILRLFSLRIAGEIAAVILSFPYRKTMFSYLSAFDPEYSSLGVGKLLLHEAIAHCFSEHYVAWNFLRGTEPYKLEWGARFMPKKRLILTRAIERPDIAEDIRPSFALSRSEVLPHYGTPVKES